MDFSSIPWAHFLFLSRLILRDLVTEGEVLTLGQVQCLYLVIEWRTEKEARLNEEFWLQHGGSLHNYTLQRYTHFVECPEDFERAEVNLDVERSQTTDLKLLQSKLHFIQPILTWYTRSNVYLKECSLGVKCNLSILTKSLHSLANNPYVAF